jgi:hypothetical protein
MKLRLLLALTLFFLLAGCAPSTAPTPTATASRTLDTRAATPAFGAVTVLPMPGTASLELRAKPNALAAVIAVAKPGDSGRLIGIDASGHWMLVEIKQKTGWAPTQYLDYTIPQ